MAPIDSRQPLLAEPSIHAFRLTGTSSTFAASNSGARESKAFAIALNIVDTPQIYIGAEPPN